MYSRHTHLKVVLTSLVAAMAVILVGMTARIVDTGSATGRPHWLPAPKKAEIIAVLDDPAAAPQIPCKQQTWPSIDRQCLSWTAPANATALSARKDDARTDAAPAAAPTIAPPPVKVAAQPPKIKQVKQAHAGKLRLARHRQNERVARYVNDDLSDLPVSSFSTVPRRSANRPYQQSAFYDWSRPASQPFEPFGFLHRNR